MQLHQMMFADRDYERAPNAVVVSSVPSVSVQNWSKRGYSVVNIQSRDRHKLLFDIVCTLTDMKYVVFHATIDTDSTQARLEFYIRHTDGSPISWEAERQRVIQCEREERAARRKNGLRCFGLEEIPEEKEVYFDGCHCREMEEMQSDGGEGWEEEEEEDGGAKMEEEMGLEGVRWAVDLGIWVMCLGVRILVSRSSSKVD